MSKVRSGVWRCKGGFAAPHDGRVIVVPDGALVPHEFPFEVMDGREHLFEDITAPRVFADPTPDTSPPAKTTAAAKKRRGRPPGSQNKPKPTDTESVEDASGPDDG